MRGGKIPKPIVAIDPQGIEKIYESTLAFMDACSPLEGSEIEPDGQHPMGWSKNSKTTIQRCCRDIEASYGGWRFRYLDRNDDYHRVIREEKRAERMGFEVPKTAKDALEAHRQRQQDDMALMSGDLNIDQIKAILRRKYGEITVFLSKIRNGEWTPPKGWSAKEEFAYLKDCAEVYGIEWSNIADTRTEADKVADAVRELVAYGPISLLERTDEELDAMEKSIDQAVKGCVRYIYDAAKTMDQCPDHVKARFNPDGSWKRGHGFSSEDEGDADLKLATEMAEFEAESMYLDVPDESPAGDIAEDESPDGDESQSGDMESENGGDSGEAGLDGASGGAPCRPAPES